MMRKTSKTKQSTRTKADGHQGKKLIIEQPTEDFDSNKEGKKSEAQMQSQEMGYSGSSASSSVTTTRNDRSSDASLSPVGRSDQKRAPKTEVHPNALKNIKNPTLLQASVSDIINPNEGKILSHCRRSLSSIDFRSVDLEIYQNSSNSTKIRPSRIILSKMSSAHHNQHINGTRDATQVTSVQLRGMP
ncbi:uncharacterized protein LOC121253320 [Juglans microcarpa x Juglans regia]|uniref:uncharacterized protein LOC121253320 n=1 Tax=Juglans microcarpa x Juglans regia TaxID=2249226 RepID=UPI001B7F1128|nr:uncharacterized protein LOC121253320 [Juglans microcarpa x Juglans regia]